MSPTKNTYYSHRNHIINCDRISTLKAQKYFWMNHGDQRVFKFKIIINVFLAFWLLAFAPRRLVRSAYVALSNFGFTAQFDIPVQENTFCIVGTARWVDLTTLTTTSSQSLDLCWDQPFCSPEKFYWVILYALYKLTVLLRTYLRRTYW